MFLISYILSLNGKNIAKIAIIDIIENKELVCSFASHYSGNLANNKKATICGFFTVLNLS